MTYWNFMQVDGTRKNHREWGNPDPDKDLRTKVFVNSIKRWRANSSIQKRAAKSLVLYWVREKGSEMLLLYSEIVDLSCNVFFPEALILVEI